MYFFHFVDFYYNIKGTIHTYVRYIFFFINMCMMMIVIIQENEKRIHATCGRKQYYYNFFSSFITF